MFNNSIATNNIQLLEAVKNNDYQKVVRCLENGADVNCRDPHSYDETPLDYAAYRGFLNIVQLLIDKGADVRSRSKAIQTPLHFAASGGHPSIIKLLLQKGAYPDLFLKDGGATPLDFAIGNNKHDTIVVLKEVMYPNSELLEAVKNGDYQKVVRCLENGADVNCRDPHSYDETPLDYAAYRGFLNIVQLLIDKGADVRSRSKAIQTPLHFAASGGHPSIIKLLLQKGAYPDLFLKDGGATPLDFAIGNNKHDTIVALKEVMATPSEQSNNKPPIDGPQTNIPKLKTLRFFPPLSPRIKDSKTFEKCLMKIKEKYAPEKLLVCFISYAWGNQYTALVQNYLVKYVRQAGFTVPFDLDHGPGSEPMPKFLDNINKADFIIVVGTKTMLEKYEYTPPKGEDQSVVKAELIRICDLVDSGHSEKIRPLLIEGTRHTSFPPALRPYVRIENFKHEDYFGGVLELVKSLYQIPSLEIENIIQSIEHEFGHQQVATEQCTIS